jgi:LmbE family N-acetylglucosaminyl deacetylase
VRPLELLGNLDRPARVLALGAHCDDIEIGCGGTLLRLLARRPAPEVLWAVFCSSPTRAREARASAEAFLRDATAARAVIHEFRDAFLPWSGPSVKEAFEALKEGFSPDVIFTHYRDDRHQDHRLVSDLTWNTWRDHLVLEYEIPKYDGDLGRPNLFVDVDETTLQRKIDLLESGYPSQRDRTWWGGDTVRALARLRGIEAATRYAEAFFSRKLVI